MKQLIKFRKIELFPGSDIIRKYSFKTFISGYSYALLAKLNHQLSAIFTAARVESAHFYENDCFECLSPHIITT